MVEILSKMSNKKFIFTCINMLNKAGKLSETNIKLLLNKDYCRRNFLCQFAILFEVPALGEISNNYCHDKSGRRRYYSKKYEIGKKTFIITNHWYGPEKSNPDNRTPFMQWVING